MVPTIIFSAIVLLFLALNFIGFVMRIVYKVVVTAVVSILVLAGVALSSGSISDLPISTRAIMAWTEQYSSRIMALGALDELSWNALRAVARSTLGLDETAPAASATPPRRPRMVPEPPSRNIQHKMDSAPDYF